MEKPGRGESPRVALIRAPLHPAAYPSRREAIIFSAPEARYVSMRIRLYRSNANSDSTGSDLLSRIEDYDSPPPPKRCSSPQRRLKRSWRISYREANTRNTATPLSDAREYSRRKFLFFPPLPSLLQSFPLPSRM